MRLTADMVGAAPVRINPAQERELDLRGLRAPAIENLGVTMDAYDAIDLCDNEVARLENFPLMKRLTTLLVANNFIARVAPDLGTSLPRLEMLILTNNRLSSLADVDVLSSLAPSLTTLSLLHNPVTRRPHYRYFVLLRFPRLRVLDFTKVKQKERIAVARFFASKAGKAVVAEVAAARSGAATATEELPTAAPVADGGAGKGDATSSPPTATASGTERAAAGGAGVSDVGLTPEQMAAMTAAMAAATTPAEIEVLEAALREGRWPLGGGARPMEA